MQHPRSPSIRRRRLSAELRRARDAAGLTTTQTVQALGWAAGKLSKIENADTQTVKAADLDRMLDLYKVDDGEIRAAMHQLARDAKERGWWSKYRDVFKNETLPDFEAEASSIRTYQSQVIPGLLQTPSYAEAIFLGGRYAGTDEIRRRVEARMARREVLIRFTPVHLRVVMDESALQRCIGGAEVMTNQIRHLLHMAKMPNVDVQVLPLNVGAHAALTAPFTILDFPNPLDPTIVCVETLTDALYLELPEDVQRYNVTFGDVQGSAVSTARSATIMSDALKALESG
ncbi:helix-turn-helix protein [Murinocardiopsis flavida]|uniref:Helix-turn-helix protein n=1 Tax=Murinocardiopsis flavida TaxID=645275 RepID=A0A2P8D6Z3_9ACTN|nr:helix-turn-helix transcriptional regulator [Murinocardiopsis flavida]PSK92961.1 helix-turn-helix protein [Murinocardiopsis flavida]